MGSPENQLELFDLSQPTAPRPRSTPLGRMVIHLRHDQAMLCAMAGLIGCTIVFAGGVERGKRLVRAERMLLSRQEPAPAPSAPSSAPTASAPSDAGETAAAKPKAPAAPAQAPTKIKVKTRYVEAPAGQPADAVPAAPSGSGSGRYAVQVVSYKRVPLAQQELRRLQGTGERAFLIMRNGLTMVYVGPFPSKQNAREKSASLKDRYQDCFVRTL